VSAAGPSRRAWGWHRLADHWAARIVAEAGVRPGELVLDIGAGEGALTGHLVRAGARVVAVELHPVRAARLERRSSSGSGFLM
jgi:23S rRNA (adenine-N6)-dimethyltransferase